MRGFLRKRIFYILCIAIALTVGIAKDPGPDTLDGFLTVTFVDVGQGDCSLIKTPGGKTLLIDGGEYDEFPSSLRPFLEQNGIDSIDFALVTHYHSDHIGGISELLDSGLVETLIIPDYDDQKKTRERLVEKAEIANVKISEISAGDFLDLGDPDLVISVLSPPKGGFSPDNENNNSIVLSLKYFDETFLFTGDLEEDAELSLIENHDLSADVLKVAHHGSSTSTCKKFIEAVDPIYAVIQAGKNNRYGHPHYEVLNLLEDDDVRIYRTDKDGDITFTVTEKGIQSISTERGTLKNGN